MEQVAKINHDFADLFHAGEQLLQEGCGEVMNRYRGDAFRHFEQLGGIPHRTENYLYADLLPVFNRDYRVVLKNTKPEVDATELFKCHVPKLDTNLILIVMKT